MIKVVQRYHMQCGFLLENLASNNKTTQGVLLKLIALCCVISQTSIRICMI